MTPKRRQGTGRAAFDHISQQLTESLSQLSRVTASQAAIADAARGDFEKAVAILERLDDDLLNAVTVAAGAVFQLGVAETTIRQMLGTPPEGTSP